MRTFSKIRNILINSDGCGTNHPIIQNRLELRRIIGNERDDATAGAKKGLNVIAAALKDQKCVQLITNEVKLRSSASLRYKISQTHSNRIIIR